MLLTTIKPHPINSTIYADTDLSDLVNSLDSNGQLETIKINKKKEIISGHRRFYSMIQLGWKEADIESTKYDNDVIALIEHNRHRIKGYKDVLMESKILEKELKLKMGGQGKRNDLNGGNKFHMIKELAKRLGIGESKLRQLKSINNYQPELDDKIEKKEISLNQAYELVRQNHMGGKKRDSVSEFSKSFKQLLQKYNPEYTEIDNVLKTTYPYNMVQDQAKSNFGGNRLELDLLKKKRLELLDNLDFKMSLDDRELVLYHKIKEFSKINTLDKTKRLKSKIWKPSNIYDKARTINEIQNLKPIIELSTNDKDFISYRKLIHSFEWVQSVGRLMKFYIKDEPTDKILGLLTIGSDLVKIECRDNYIGWTDYNKSTQKKINHTAVASSIVPVQPFGFHFLGGKLIALLSTTNVIRDEWEKRYGDKLVGLTTTSLYGSYSMYSNLVLWKKCGSSRGKVYIKPDEEIYSYWLQWVRENQRDFYDETMGGMKTGSKQKMLNHIYMQLGMKASHYFTWQKRGVFFSSFYSNTKEFLKGEIEESDLILKPQIADGMDYINNWWLSKSLSRYEKLYMADKLQPEVLWYDDVAKSKSDFNRWLETRGLNSSL